MQLLEHSFQAQLLPDSLDINPITGPWCPEGFRELRFPDYLTVDQNSGKVVSFYLQKMLVLISVRG